MKLFRKKAKSQTERVIIHPTLQKVTVAIFRANYSPEVVVKTIKGNRLASSDLHDLIRDFNVEYAQATIILGLGDYQLIPIAAPKVPESERKAAVPWLVQDLIESPLDDVAIDAFSYPVRTGQEEQLYVVVANKQQLIKQVEELDKINLEVNEIIVSELALKDAVPESSEKAIAIVHHYDKQFGIVVVKDNIIYLTRHFTLGHTGSEITESTAKSLAHECARSVEFLTSQHGIGIDKLYASKDLLNEDHLQSVLAETLGVDIEPLHVSGQFSDIVLENAEDIDVTYVLGAALEIKSEQPAGAV